MRSGRRPHVALVHSEFQWGGGEAVTVWAIQALAAEFDLTVVTASEFPLPKLNDFYGTDLPPDAFLIERVPLPLRLQESNRFWLLKYHLVMRYCKGLGATVDLFFSTFGEMDFRKPGIQYVHFPALAEDFSRTFGAMHGAWYHRDSLLRRAYRGVCERLSGFSIQTMARNATLVNSRWTGNLVTRAYGIVPRVVYPPVPGEFPDIPWEARENGFVCIGRVSREKRLDQVISILHRVRQKGYDIHLHIVGPMPDSTYARSIRSLRQEHAGWVFLEGQLSRDDLCTLITRHRYGIHGMPHEHFGIAVAEMVKGGCITFVPRGGGQVEIVADEEHLVSADEGEAVDKITRVLTDDGLQIRMREHLWHQRQRFSAARFMTEIRSAVIQALDL